MPGGELVRGDVGADVDAVLEPHALAFELGDAAVDVPLLELEVGDAEAEQPTRALVALEHDDVVAGARELLRGGQAGRARADDRHAAPAAVLGGMRDDPALLPRPLDDRQLDLLDRHGVVVDREHAGGLARRRADQAGELGEVVRRVQLVDRLAPAALVDQVVPVRDQVAERAAVMAERDAALHAAGALARRLGLRQDLEDLTVVVHARAWVPLGGGHATDLQEGAELTHGTRKRSQSGGPPPVLDFPRGSGSTSRPRCWGRSSPSG